MATEITSEGASTGSQTPPGDAGSKVGGVRLDQVEAGHCGIVMEVMAGEDDIEHLKAMGVCIGRKIMLVQTGDPLILKVLGTRIGVSGRLAARVHVSPCGGDAFGIQTRA